MEKSELKRQGVFTADFPRKNVAYKDIESIVITIVTITSAFLMGRTELFGMMSVLSASFVSGFIGEWQAGRCFCHGSLCAWGR